ncbi:transcriptional regulator with divergent AAA domain [Staphylococcus aureus]|nr:transcriptional regulator with divergent AAA domain [Staphylococcus aureus]
MNKEDYLKNIVSKKISNGAEDSTTEFKVNNDDPKTIGEYISALGNSATLEDKDYAYMIWGIEDESKKVVGTKFHPNNAKKGQEDLQNWLHRMIKPSIDFTFDTIDYDGKNITILRIPKAIHQPISFNGEEFIRVGSYKKKLRDYPEKEKQLWKKFQELPFESLSAYLVKNYDEIFELLDYESYYKLLKQPLPIQKDLIIDHFKHEEIIKENEGNVYITNLGAILLAKNLDNFKPLKRKAPRVIKYKGNNKIETISEQVGIKGYACGFEGLIKYINNLLPSNEVIGEVFRETVQMYPELAIRELVANSLIHQDLLISGAGPVIEIFDNRIEIVNPGTPLIKVERFLDSPPKSRNESLASLLRRMGICEERGTGIDKVISETEKYQLPAPLITLYDEFIKVTLHAYKDINDMTREEKIRATYMHACLKYVESESITNQSLRKRFGLEDKKISVISRIIKDTVAEEYIKPVDPETSPRHMRYIPYWA